MDGSVRTRAVNLLRDMHPVHTESAATVSHTKPTVA